MEIPLLTQTELEAQMYNNLANNLMSDGYLDSALALFRKSILLNPKDDKAVINLAAALITWGEVDEAEKLANEVLQQNPNQPFAWSIKGFVGLERGDVTMSIQSFERAVQLRPDSAMTQFDRCAGYLMSGNWDIGWKLHEGRRVWRPERQFKIPTWNGESDAHVYVWSEQGLGDCINFARYIPWLSERVKKITFGVHYAVFGLMQGYNKWAEVIPMDFPIPDDATHELAHMSLPYFHKTTPYNVPPDPGVLKYAIANGQLGGTKKIGLVWSGSPAQSRNYSRSVPLKKLLPLTSRPDLTFYSLQVGAASRDIADAQAQALVTDLSGIIAPDWSITAAMLKNLDALVTVDTGTAHLAGAMGIPTALMLSTGHCWRYMIGRKDTPWYPNMTLFRQKKLNQWDPVVADVAEWLKNI